LRRLVGQLSVSPVELGGLVGSLKGRIIIISISIALAMVSVESGRA